MGEINIIVAMNKDRVIGVDNALPWYLSEDLQYFRKLTLGSVVIMGRKTYESIGMPLPHRENIIISRNVEYIAPIKIFGNLNEAILYANGLKKKIFIIGGGELYKNAILIATKLFITEVEIEVKNATTYFPIIDYVEWELVSKKSFISKNNINYHFCEYKRLKNNISSELKFN
jgi:dihydrofolate reductase